MTDYVSDPSSPTGFSTTGNRAQGATYTQRSGGTYTDDQGRTITREQAMSAGRVDAPGEAEAKLAQAGVNQRAGDQERQQAEGIVGINAARAAEQRANIERNQMNPEKAGAIQRMLESRTAQFADQGTAQRAYDIAARYNRSFAPEQVKAGIAYGTVEERKLIEHGVSRSTVRGNYNPSNQQYPRQDTSVFWNPRTYPQGRAEASLALNSMGAIRKGYGGYGPRDEIVSSVTSKIGNKDVTFIKNRVLEPSEAFSRITERAYSTSVLGDLDREVQTKLKSTTIRPYVQLARLSFLKQEYDPTKSPMSRAMMTYTRGMGEGIAERPSAGIISFGVGGVIGGIGKLASSSKILTTGLGAGKVTSKINALNLAGASLAIPYGASVVGRVATAKNPVHELGKISSTELIPMGLGAGVARGVMRNIEIPTSRSIINKISKKPTDFRDLMPAATREIYNKLPTKEAKTMLKTSFEAYNLLKDMPVSARQSMFNKDFSVGSVKEGGSTALKVMEILKKQREDVLLGSASTKFFIKSLRTKQQITPEGVKVNTGIGDIEFFSKTPQLYTKTGFPFEEIHTSSHFPQGIVGERITTQFGGSKLVLGAGRVMKPITTPAGKMLDPLQQLTQKIEGEVKYLSRKTNVLTGPKAVKEYGTKGTLEGFSTRRGKDVFDIPDIAKELALKHPNKVIGNKVSKLMKEFETAEQTKLYSGIPIEKYAKNIIKNSKFKTTLAYPMSGISRSNNNTYPQYTNKIISGKGYTNISNKIFKKVGALQSSPYPTSTHSSIRGYIGGYPETTIRQAYPVTTTRQIYPTTATRPGYPSNISKFYPDVPYKTTKPIKLKLTDTLPIKKSRKPKRKTRPYITILGGVKFSTLASTSNPLFRSGKGTDISSAFITKSLKGSKMPNLLGEKKRKKRRK